MPYSVYSHHYLRTPEQTGNTLHRRRLIQQRLALAVLRDHRVLAEEDVATRILGSGDVERLHEEDGEDDESKDPLQGNGLDGKLLERQAYFR